MDAPQGGSCNSNTCMKLSFEGRRKSIRNRDSFAARGRVPKRPQAFVLADRVRREDSPAQNSFAKRDRGASHGFRSVPQAEGMARPRAVVHDQARASGGADL